MKKLTLLFALILGYFLAGPEAYTQRLGVFSYDNTYGQLGDGTFNAPAGPSTIYLVGSDTNWITGACGAYHNLAIKSDRTLWAWGRNHKGQLGDSTLVNKNTPTQVGVATNWAKFDGGGAFSMAIKTDGTLWGWGDNSQGQLGDGTTIDKLTPVQIGTAAEWLAVTCGLEFVLAMKTDSTLWAWGDNAFGQLGDGTTTDKLAPVQIGADKWIQIAAGNNLSIGMKSDSLPYTWGQGATTITVFYNGKVMKIDATAAGGKVWAIKTDSVLSCFTSPTSMPGGSGNATPDDFASDTIDNTDNPKVQCPPGQYFNIGIKKCQPCRDTPRWLSGIHLTDIAMRYPSQQDFISISGGDTIWVGSVSQCQAINNQYEWYFNTSLVWKSIDGGVTQALVVQAGCTNPVAGGTIGANQSINYNTVPATLTNVTAPAGQSGFLEYKWQSSANGITFADIPLSNAADFSPGALTVTTWYRRLARVDCLANWAGAAISDTVTITVGSPVVTPTVEFPSGMWTEMQPAGAIDNLWSTVSVSGDGNVILAGVYFGRLYLSTDGGTSWTETRPAGDADKAWYAASVSADGSKMVAAVKNGRVYLSTNGGTSWVDAQADGANDRNWNSVSISADGTKILAGVWGGRLYMSANGGASWSQTEPAGAVDKNWSSVYVSGDGSKMIAGVYDGRLYMSTNGGTSWAERQPTGNSDQYWNIVSISADGNKVLAGIKFGRLYLSTNGGTNWAETQPAGDANKKWQSVSLSTDGSKIITGALTGRLYLSTNTGANWAETQPAGDANKDWMSASISADGNTMFAGAYPGRFYKYMSQQISVTNITSTAATGNGKITNLNGGGDATNRGVIYYPYTNTDKIIGDATVTNVSTNGTYGIGAFTAGLTGLLVNTHYNLRAHATNPEGTGYSARCDFWTQANVPAAPVVINPLVTSLDVSVNVNSNPSGTQFAIYETSQSKFIQADGTLATSAVWQTAATWDTITVTGLTSGNTYTFKAKARNGDSVETAYGATANGIPREAPTVTTQAVSSITATTATGNGNITATNGANATIRGLIYYPYTDTNKEIGNAGVTNVADTGTYSTGAFTKSFAGLSVNNRYNVRAHATNIVGNSYGSRVDFWTLANIPDAPTVINPTATSLDVAVKANGNPSSTLFAIQDSVNNTFVQSDGTRTATAVWQTAAVWDTITVTGLNTGATYYFRVKAKNGAAVETAYSITTARNTCSNPVNGGTISAHQEICYGSAPVALTNAAHASNYGGVLEYQWQSSTTSNTTNFSDIIGADTAGYVPGTLTETTWYRRLSRVSCKPDWVGATSSNVVKITVDPTTVGGSVSGDTLVCYGSHSSVLTLSGQTGTVQKWQYSTDGTNWSDLTGHTQTTYTAENLITDTWYRAVVQSGVCQDENSDAHKISVFSDYKISGYAKYENNPKTPLSGLKVLLRNGADIVDSVVTTAAGYYEFDSLANGNYGLVMKSAHPSGQWQTWGGVNNTDYLLVSKHIAGTQYLPVNPPVVQITASTKLPHPAINSADANAIRQATKFPATGWQYFDIPKWVFSGLDASTPLDNIEVACSDVTRDIRGLCGGDVNGTYVPPTGVKTVHATSLQLVNRGTLPITDEIVFPIRVDRDMEIGAITLYLDYDPSMMVVTNVTTVPTVTNSPELWFNVPEPTLNLKPETLNTLQIGWMSMEPIRVKQEETLLLIHARLTEAYRTSHFTFNVSHLASGDLNVKPEMRNVKCEIRFALNDTQISEFADGDGNVIGGLKLSIPDARIDDGNVKTLHATSLPMAITVYPNPAQSTLNLKLETINLKPKTLNLELLNIHATKVWGGGTQTIVSGWNEFQIDVSGLAPGVYFLRANVGGEILMKKVVISR